jgi:tyrosinase
MRKTMAKKTARSGNRTKTKSPGASARQRVTAGNPEAIFSFTRHGRRPGAPTLHLAAAVEAPVERKDEASLSESEQQHYKVAIQAAIDNGVYGQFVAFHADMRHRMHSMSGAVGTQRFLSWHRAFLIKLEEVLRGFAPHLALPYWNWTAERAVPTWMKDFRPTGEHKPGGAAIIVKRNPGVAEHNLPTPAEIDAILKADNYLDFTTGLEDGPHNQVHRWVGGTMDDIMWSPADPLFWLHHAQIDRIWSIWQRSHPSMGPNLSGKNAILDPWNDLTADAVQKIDYTYGPPH